MQQATQSEGNDDNNMAMEGRDEKAAKQATVKLAGRGQHAG
jgi:hypothetical protein